MLGYLVVGLAIILEATADDCRPESCPGHGAKLLPVPSDCSQYISCLDGQHSVRNCPEGLRFDKGLGECVRPDQAKCDSCDESNEKGERKPLPQIQLELDGLPKSNNISERCRANSVTPIKCPEDIGEDRLLPHPDDCRLYYVCLTAGERPICRDCPIQLHFNPDKKVCDHPNVAGCRV